MRWAVFGLVFLAIVATLVIGTDDGRELIRRGLYEPPRRTVGPGRVIPLGPDQTFRLIPPRNPLAPPAIVLSKYTIGNDYCVRYEIRGTWQSACHGSAGRATCYDVARVGDQLPEGCR